MEAKLRLTETRFHFIDEGGLPQVVAHTIDLLFLALLFNGYGGEKVLVEELTKIISPYNEIRDAVYTLAEDSRKELESSKLPVDPFTALFDLPLIEHFDTPIDLLFLPSHVRCKLSISNTKNLDEERRVGNLIKRRQTKAILETLNVKSTLIKVDILFILGDAKFYSIRLEEQEGRLVASKSFSSILSDFERSENDVPRQKMPAPKDMRTRASIIEKLIDLYSVMTVYEKHTLKAAKTLKLRGYWLPSP